MCNVYYLGSDSDLPILGTADSSADGKRIAYTAHRVGQWFVLLDGETAVPVDGIVDNCLAWSPHNRTLAYLFKSMYWH
ncbi:MAG TPA: hypothetical protein VFE51_11950 [Verrucomicrobiae bacterium]|nr:hypothetical protein [Verrucomicrobiae bacterium]